MFLSLPTRPIHDVRRRAIGRFETTAPHKALLYRLIALLVAAAGAFSLFAQQAPPTKSVTIPLNFFIEPSFCTGFAAPQTRDLGQFNDTLSSAAKLRSASFGWSTGNNKTFSFQGVPSVTISLDGTALATLDITNPAACNPTGKQIYAFTSQDYPNGFPGYVYTSNGSPGVNTISMALTGTDAAALLGDMMSITLTYEVPPPIEFSVTDSAPETERHILLSNLHPGYPYPHFQSLGGKDSEVPMFLRARGQSGQYETGLTVYLRVSDPEDTAPYTNLPQNKIAHKNDNAGPVPTIDGTGITTVANTSGVYQATSGANGEVDFSLKLKQGTASGDNYQIEASFDQTFPTGASWKSGTLTAWKRVFVEHRRELKNTVFLVQDAQPGDSTIHVADNRCGGNMGRHRISRGDRIILVHAPAVDRSNITAGWYSEEHTVADVGGSAGNFAIVLGTKAGKIVTPEALAQAFGRDPAQPSVAQLTDAVACLTSATLSSSDYFDAADDLATALVKDAFVEYLYLPDSPVVPLPKFGSSDEVALQQFADKWSTSGAGTPNSPNHQLLIIGDSNGEPLDQNAQAGVTVSHAPGETSSWVWRGRIQEQVSTHGSPNAGGNPDSWASKVIAHELGHQWKSNTTWGLNDHCPETSKTYDDPNLYCLLADYTQAKEAQESNGVARFHLLPLPGGGWHSEYLEIRKHADPVVP